MNRFFLILSVLVFLPLSVKSQESIGGVVNSYYKVVSNATLGSTYVTCDGPEDLSGLNPGDKVLLIQMTGAYFPMIGTWYSALQDNYTFGNTGVYEFLSVESVTGQDVNFTAALKRSYAAGEKIQLVKIYETETATVTSQLQAAPWNGDKGGIVALVILKKLILNANIDAGGSGFRGGAIEDYNGTCRPAYSPDTLFFLESYNNRAGHKGESIMQSSFSYTKGAGFACNGGGGGAGLYGGGGGGGNYGYGGIGGFQPGSGPCAPDVNQKATGGNYLTGLSGLGFYSNSNNWVVFGGGGGSATQTTTYTGSNGGNGGGIVFILADSIVGNGYAIRANGSNASNVQAGGSGGGAGGSILIDAAAYSGNLTISARGGNGGNSGTSCGGGGGAGGGGIFWYSGSSLPSSVTTSLIAGTRGSYTCGSYGGNGSNGATLSALKPVLNGFLFNSIRDNDTICQGKIPRLLVGTTPKGAGTFTYQWLQSSDNNNWTPIASSNIKDYQPTSLNSTTYYTRVVDNGEIKDTAISIQILVYPSISGNAIYVTDTICYGVSPGLLNGSSVTGGNNSYSYNWQSKTTSTSWQTIGSLEDHNETSSLTNSTFYRRIVISAKVCRDTSETDTITVLPLIVNNEFITPDTTICNGLPAGVLVTNNISGGDGTYTYQWRISTNNVTYNTIGGAVSPTYNPGALTGNRFYKRIVFSGNGNACKDTSNPRTITVLPSITNNTISTSATLYCFNSVPGIVTGNPPGGGQSGVYTYQWFVSEGSQFDSIPGGDTQHYQPPALDTTSKYRRRVISGLYGACVSTSNEITINIVPEIKNTLQSPDENICAEGVPQSFSENIATGGSGGFTYKWIQKTTSTNWINAPGANTTISYSSPAIIVPADYSFSRVATSSICPDTSNSITVLVYPSITQNTIGASNQYVCYNQSETINASSPTGGNNTYTYYWQSSPDASTWSGAGNNEDLQNLTLTTPTYYQRIVHSGETAQCKDTSAIAYIHVNPLPTGDIISSLDTLCAGEEISINYQSLTGNGPWIIELGNNSNQTIYTSPSLVSTSGSLNFVLDNSTSINILSLIDDSLCYADLTGNTGLVQATVYEVPVANAGETFEVCGLQAQLAAQPSIGLGIWSINSNGTFNDTTLPNALVTNDSYGTFDLTWTESNWRECTSQDIVTVTFFESPLDVNAGEDITTINYDTTLNAVPPAVGYAYWQKAGGNKAVTFNDSTLNNTLVYLEGEGEYILKWVVVNGICPAVSDSMKVIVGSTTYYEGFSPDGNGINETFKIEFTAGKTGTLTIFNRNGLVIREISGVTPIEWDGSSESGTQVPDGTYYYIFVRDDKDVKPKKGYIELRRQRQ